MKTDAPLLATKPDTGELHPRFDALRLKYAELNGIGQSLRQRQQELTEQVALAKTRVALAPDVTDLLDKLQQKAHHRSVGLFEDMLTAIVQDVFPEKGAVKLALSSERNAPALDLFLQNGEFEEDILEGSGGAINNVVVAGLRYGARARTKNRALMVLDESDCWIKPDLVPAYIKVVTDIAAQTGTQTLMISHHDDAYFEGDVAIVRLERNAEGQVTAVPLEPRPSPWANDNEPGLRWIELVNVGAHEHTLIPLLPGVNALIGVNDLGKSTALVAALRAVAYGESSDTLLHHGAEFARVRIGLEQGYVLEWTRKRKGSPKVSYALYQHGELLREGKPESRGSVPDFIDDLLGIRRVDNMDIQLVSQKQPIFLLNEPPARRAQLLSIGRESGFLRALIDKHRTWMTRDRETIRHGEAELMRIQRRLRALDDLAGIAPLLEMLSQLLKEVDEAERAEKLVRLLVLRLEAYSTEMQRYSRRIAALETLPRAAPELQDLTALGKLIRRIAAVARLGAVELHCVLPTVPELTHNRPIVELGRRLAQAQKVVDAAAHLPTTPLEVPEIDPRANERLWKVAQSLAQAQKIVDAAALLPTTPLEVPELDPRANERLLKLAKAVSQATTTLAQQEQEWAEVERQKMAAELDLGLIEDELGGVCPLCGHLLHDEAAHTALPQGETV